MTVLKMSTHMTTGRRMVEVYDDAGKIVATIYPGPGGSNSVHIVSAYFAGPPIHVPTLPGIPNMPGAPTVESYLLAFK